MDGDGDLGATTEIGDYRSDQAARGLGRLGSALPPEAQGDGNAEPQDPGTSVETAILLELSVALLADPPTELTLIRVNSEEGIVTLTGEVGNPEVRRMAGEIASSHPGVASAINDLQVSSSSGPEEELEEGEQTSRQKGGHDEHSTFLQGSWNPRL